MSKRSLVDSIEVKNPCSEDWNRMTGDERVRHCGHCDLSVTNLSTLTRKQALRLVRESNGRLCVRYMKNPVDNSPMFAGRLYQITRRAGLAAGVLGATLSLSTLAYAQDRPVLIKRNPTPGIVQTNAAEKDKTETASLAGFVVDPQGALLPNALVTIRNEATNETFSLSTDEQGGYKFENLPAGRYKLTVNGGNAFAVTEIGDVTLAAGDQTRQDVSLNPVEIAIVNVTGEAAFMSGMIAVVQYRTPLHEAVSNDDLAAVKEHIARGVGVNLKDENYSRITPLFLAVENGNAEIAETLLSFGAKVNARDDNRQTPLMRLDEDAAPGLVNVLIKYGAKMNLVDAEGNTALIFAARAAGAEVLQLLIGHGARLDTQNREGRTALMEAAEADHLENVRALLAAGAAVNLKDRAGETALELTTDREIEQLLVEYGATQKEK